MTYRLYGVEDFANLAVHLVLEDLSAPYSAHFLDPAELKSPDHLARHPLGLVPAMETPDGPLFETAAILLYLADRRDPGAPKPDSPDRAALLSWLFFTSNALHTVVMDLIHPHRVGGDEAAPEVARIAHDRLRARLPLIEGFAATRPGWLSPENPGILGAYLSMLLRWTAVFAADPALAIRAADYPALHALAAACETRPAFLRVAAQHGLSGRFLSDPQG